MYYLGCIQYLSFFLLNVVWGLIVHLKRLAVALSRICWEGLQVTNFDKA